MKQWQVVVAVDPMMRGPRRHMEDAVQVVEAEVIEVTDEGTLRLLTDGQVAAAFSPTGWTSVTPYETVHNPKVPRQQ